MFIWDELKLPIYEKWRQWWFETHPKDIAEYSWSYLFTGGKEIRPKLFCELWHYLSPDLKINAELAFAIECIHLVSIILDDTTWMDNAKERRGKPTLHTVFSSKKALLIVNDILTMVIIIWNNNKPDHINDTIWKQFLISKLHRLTAGQSLDLDKKGNLIELASLKTGVLFELVTESVAIFLDLDTTFWCNWGNSLGILFQWMDDYLDMEEDIIQQNRNAFNESYQFTLENYGNIWTKIEKDIGAQWFERTFGQFMKTYFLKQINLNLKSTKYISLSEIYITDTSNIITPISEIPQNNIECNYFEQFIFGLSRQNIITRIFTISSHIFSLSVTPFNQWEIVDT